MATMRDVAQRAGVSYTTVSFVLNKRDSPRGIGAETRRRVIEAARELDYRPNEFARAVVRGTNRILGLLIKSSTVNSEYKTRIQTGVLEEASQHSYVVKIMHYSDRFSQEDVIEQSLSWRLAGLIIAGIGEEVTAFVEEKLASHNIPVATIGELHRSLDGIKILTDDEEGLRVSMRHLLEQGHERIAYLAASTDKIALRRTAIFRELMGAHNLPVPEDYVVKGDWWDIEKNKLAASYLLSLPGDRRPTAIVCCGDPAAVTTINTARSFGVAVPGDLSVVGFGDFTIALFSDPPLTTVAEPFVSQGREAARGLIALAEDSSGTIPVDELATNEENTVHLVERSSTSRCLSRRPASTSSV